MRLLLDVGNSRIKWCLADAKSWQPGEPLLRGNKAFKDLARPAWAELEAPERVIVSNVAGEDYQKSIRTWIKRRWKIDAEFLQSSAQCCGVTNAYPIPERLGPDRWACLLAAHALYSKAVCIIDCGSAISVDALSAKGEHLGGLITPGLDMMVSAITDRAPGVSLEEPGEDAVSLLGRDTASAVRGGTLYAAVALVDRVYSDISDELGKSVIKLITGGDAERILPLLSATPEHVPDLVLKGLNVYANEAICAT